MFDNLKWPKEVPKEVYWKALESIHRQRIREVAAAKAHADGLDRLKAEYRDSLHNLIGGNKLRRYQKLHNARLSKLRQAGEMLPDEKGGPQQREELRLRLVKASTEEIGRSGVNLSELTALRQAYVRKAAALFERTVGKGKIGEMIPMPRNTDYYPPYLLDAREYDHYESEDSLPEPSVTRHFDGRTGDFGSRTRIHVSGADEWDLVSATCRTGFLLIYQNTRTGLPVVNLDLEVVDLNYQGYISNECGYSSASVWQDGRLFGQVYLGGGEALRTYCPTYLVNNRRSGREGSWSETVMRPGTDFSLSFVLATPVPADTFVLIGIGVETYNDFLSNDCGVDSTIEVRLLARRIGITTTS